MSQRILWMAKWMVILKNPKIVLNHHLTSSTSRSQKKSNHRLSVMSATMMLNEFRPWKPQCMLEELLFADNYERLIRGRSAAFSSVSSSTLLKCSANRKDTPVKRRVLPWSSKSEQGPNICLIWLSLSTPNLIWFYRLQQSSTLNHFEPYNFEPYDSEFYHSNPFKVAVV